MTSEMPPQVQLTWSEIMNMVPSGLLSPEEKGKVSFHVLIEKSVSASDLQAAAVALIKSRVCSFEDNHNHHLLDTEWRAIASLFKALLAAADHRASSVMKVAKIITFLTQLEAQEVTSSFE